MAAAETAPEWTQLIELLAPLHEQTRLLARRLARSNADGDDLFQEALLRAQLKLPSLRDRAAFRAWFHRILFSVHRSRTRRGFWRRLLSLDDPAAEVAEPAGSDGAAEADQRAAAARAAAALATLAPEQREAIVLAEIQEFSLEEVAELQGASLSAVKSRVSRGRERLRAYYRRIGRDEPAAKEEEGRAYSRAL